MDKSQAPSYEEPEIIEATFYASQDETYFIWVDRYGEKEAKRLWQQCCSDDPIPQAL